MADNSVESLFFLRFCWKISERIQWCRCQIMVFLNRESILEGDKYIFFTTMHIWIYKNSAYVDKKAFFARRVFLHNIISTWSHYFIRTCIWSWQIPQSEYSHRYQIFVVLKINFAGTTFHRNSTERKWMTSRFKNHTQQNRYDLVVKDKSYFILKAKHLSAFSLNILPLSEYCCINR